MRILYLLKEKKTDTNTILNEVKNETIIQSINKSDINDENENNFSNSNLTVYFPDKVNMKNIIQTKEAVNIPKIDFNQVPEYSFQSEEEKRNNNNDNGELLNQDEYNYNEIGLNNYHNFGFNDFNRNSA